MGYDLVAYFDLNQDEIEQFVMENNIDKKNCDQSDMIVDYYKTKHLSNTNFTLDYMIYAWNEDCQMHEIMQYYGTNFIRDDERFDNRRYHKMLEDKYGISFPQCLQGINYTLRTSNDAKEVAKELRVFFPDDISLMHFADWLEETAKYCSTYELSC